MSKLKKEVLSKNKLSNIFVSSYDPFLQKVQPKKPTSNNYEYSSISQPLDYKLTIRLSESDKFWIKSKCARDKIKPSTLIRNFINREREANSKPCEQVHQLSMHEVKRVIRSVNKTHHTLKEIRALLLNKGRIKPNDIDKALGEVSKLSKMASETFIHINRALLNDN